MNRAMGFDQGPYLLAAFLCERVLNETDGVQSAIRIVDRFTHSVVVDTHNVPMEPFNHPITFFLLLKAGVASGSYNLRITLVKPSGDSPEPFQQPIYFEGDEDRGVALSLGMVLRLEMPGIHWFDVHLDDVRLTRVPFRVIYMPQVKQTHGQRGV